jgi:hypothetical protein
MPTFQKCDKSVREMADALLNEFESHKPLLDAKVTNDALSLHGVKALGIARKLSLKDRAMGRGDAEISLDGDWWKETASEEQQRALLDHELHHLSLVIKKHQITYDALGRPNIRMRKHDVQVGWFAVIAQRHGKHSQEQIQAATILDSLGQFFWPQIASGPVKQVSKGK